MYVYMHSLPLESMARWRVGCIRVCQVAVGRRCAVQWWLTAAGGEGRVRSLKQYWIRFGKGTCRHCWDVTAVAQGHLYLAGGWQSSCWVLGMKIILFLTQFILITMINQLMYLGRSKHFCFTCLVKQCLVYMLKHTFWQCPNL